MRRAKAIEIYFQTLTGTCLRRASGIQVIISRGTLSYFRPRKRIRAMNARRSKLLNVRNSGELTLLFTV
jgi:hypothetical protein